LLGIFVAGEFIIGLQIVRSDFDSLRFGMAAEIDRQGCGGRPLAVQKVLHRLVEENSRYSARDHDSVATKQDNVRRARPTVT
jgi:hypothetical protein